MKITTIENTPRMTHKGVIYVKKQPIYIIEVMEEGYGLPTQYATLYEVQKDSNPPIRAYKMAKKTVGYKSTTALGRLASKLHAPTTKLIRQEEPPVFMVDIQYGKDTFTGKEGRGFYEREKDVIQVTTEGIKVKHGEPTGVFIALSSVTWGTMTISTEDVMQEYQARKLIWRL